MDENLDSSAVPYLDRLGGEPSNRNSAYSEKFSTYEDWQDDPESIPKGENYYEHDNRERDDMTYWERKQLFQSTGHRFPRSRDSYRGRTGFRPRGFTMRGRGRAGFIPGERGRGRGFSRFNYQRGNTSYRGSNTSLRGSFDRRYSNDEWKHDKYVDLEKEDEPNSMDEELGKDKDFEETEKGHHKSTKSKSGDLKRKSDSSINGKDKKVKKDKKHKEQKKEKTKHKEKSARKNEKESSKDVWASSEPIGSIEGKHSDDLSKLEIKEEVSIS